MATQLRREASKPAETIFGLLAPIIKSAGAVNIASGFPDWDAPRFVKEHTADALLNGTVQYGSPAGCPELKSELKKLYDPLYKKDLNQAEEILVTMGGGHANMCAFGATCERGDEVLILEPFFSFYSFQLKQLGIVPRYVPLMEDRDKVNANERWVLDEVALRKAVTPRTKAVIINNPHNPTGKTFTLEELEVIASVVREHDLLVFSDEVYEFLTFATPENNLTPHHRIALLDDMFWRTLTIFSASKMFSVTGFRVGWIVGPEWLITKCRARSTAHVFAVSTPLTRGLARSFAAARTNGYLADCKAHLAAQSNKLFGVLTSTFGDNAVAKPQGGYFIVVDISKIPRQLYARSSDDPSKPSDFIFSLWLIEVIGVACMPMTGFYSPRPDLSNGEAWSAGAVRFCFAKEDETIAAAGQKLKKLKDLLNKEP